MSEKNQEKDQGGTQNLFQKECQIKKNIGVKEDEDRFKIHSSLHYNFAIRYFNMVVSYLGRYKK